MKGAAARLRTIRSGWTLPGSGSLAPMAPRRAEGGDVTRASRPACRGRADRRPAICGWMRVTRASCERTTLAVRRRGARSRWATVVGPPTGRSLHFHDHTRRRAWPRERRARASTRTRTKRRRAIFLHGLYVKRSRISHEENIRATSFDRQSPQTHHAEAIANNHRDGARCAVTTSRYATVPSCFLTRGL